MVNSRAERQARLRAPHPNEGAVPAVWAAATADGPVSREYILEMDRQDVILLLVAYDQAHQPVPAADTDEELRQCLFDFLGMP